MPSDEWQLLFGRLQTRFDSAAQRHPDLGCVLFHYDGSELHRREGPVVKAKRDELCLFCIAEAADYGEVGPGLQPPCREIYVQRYRPPAGSDKAAAQQAWDRTEDAIDELRHLAGSASDLLRELPTAVRASIPHVPTFRTTPCRAGSDYASWLFLVFELAWQRRPGSVLRVERHFWLESQGQWLDENWCDPQRWAEWARGSVCQKGWVERTPGFFYSDVQDIFRASADAVALLLATGEARQDEPGKRDGQPREPEQPWKLQPPNQFVWRERETVELPTIPYKLLAYLLQNPRSQEQDVIDAVWGHDAEKNVSTIKSTISGINFRLSERAIPVTISRRGGYVILTIDRQS